MGFSTVVGILFYVLWLLWTAAANVAFIMMGMMVSVEGGRLIPRPETVSFANRRLRSHPHALLQLVGVAPLGTPYGWMTTAICTGKYAGVRVLCWAEVRIDGGAFGDRCLIQKMVKKIDRGDGLQQGALPP